MLLCIFRKMVNVTKCIETNIRIGCGEKAAELVHLLVKPTVPGSGRCVYPMYQDVSYLKTHAIQ